jgi:predicted NBD/HSP70 family sugar kinase
LSTTASDLPSPADLDAGATSLLALIRRHGPLTRTHMNELTGWARVTVTSRLEQLLDGDFVVVDGVVAGARGRPAARYRIDATRAIVLVADIGASGMKLARVDLDGEIEETADRRVEIGEGPDRVLGIARSAFIELVDGARGRPIWGVGMSLPGPVEFGAGVVVKPPIMTGWEGIPVRDIVSSWFDAPVHVDNDVNAMAVGEQSANLRGASDLLVVKVGTGVGCGIIADGHVLRGASGAAGDIGHTWADTGGIRRDPPECRCGKRGCVEAYAGGWALARNLSTEFRRAITVDAVVELLRTGDSTAVRLARDGGRVLGASLATAVSLLNPSAVVLGGQVAAAAGEHLLAGLRERVYARSLPLATRNLPIQLSSLWPDAGIRGLATGVADMILGDRGSPAQAGWTV